MVCAKEGFRKIKYEETIDHRCEPKPITRYGCMDASRMKYNLKSSEWIALEFE